MSNLRFPVTHNIFSAKGTTGVGTSFNCDSFRHVVFSFATDGGADAALTVKFQGSVQVNEPDFSAAQSVTNHWDYIAVADLQSGSIITGDTGVTVATADDYRLLEANTNGLRWVNAVITARSQGEATVSVRAYIE